MTSTPEFQPLEGYEYDVLPDGVHLVDEATFYERFVEAFLESGSRQEIYDGFIRLRDESCDRGISGTQWVNGSFVESKPNPEDVDVVTFCDYDQLNELDAAQRMFVEMCLAGGAATRDEYITHTFLVASCGSEHDYYPIFEQFRAYWRQWFGTTRTGQEKGILEMTMGDPEKAPGISHSRVDS